MSVATRSLAIPEIRDIGVFLNRSPQSKGDMNLPPGTRLVSADNHWEITKDIFYENFPTHLRDKAPRVWFDGFWRIGYRGQVEALPIGERTTRAIVRTNGTDWTPERRYSDMDAEGVDEEICFPNTLIGFARYPEFAVQEALYRVYNEHYAAGHIERRSRSHAVGVFSNWWDPAAAEGAMQQIVDLGLKTFMIPVNPGKSVDGKEIHYQDPIMDRFWDVVAEAGLPVCFHVGEGTDVEHRGGVGALNMTLLAPFRKPFGQLVFGGVFDRHPDLQVVFAEGGISWVPPALQDAEMIFDSFGNGDIVDRLDHRPSEYWRQNCYATFQNDPLGLSQLDYIGADRCMWATDYPHSEGAFGYGRTSVRAVVDSTSTDDARAILGGNAIKVFKLDK
ncbi:amidohydrolase family protein [Phenylobacterium sp. LjRoot225]|uniref:amidohydrolase family protein n=1 Tax=Phenylobacterium sp. LjRoot225 TaxID=3342285 RepID=UPI003ECC58F8